MDFLDKTYSLSEDVVWREVEGEVILLNINTGDYFALNETASEFWKLFCSEEPDILERLTEVFDVDGAHLRSDIEKTLENLVSESIIYVSGK